MSERERKELQALWEMVVFAKSHADMMVALYKMSGADISNLQYDALEKAINCRARRF